MIQLSCQSRHYYGIYYASYQWAYQPAYERTKNQRLMASQSQMSIDILLVLYTMRSVVKDLGTRMGSVGSLVSA
jgi:hypothetical protein